MKKEFDILYTKDSLGNTRVWWMVQEGGSYYTMSGIKDGALVQSESTVCEGKNIGKKNETSATIQAQREIESKYKKQLKTGYHKNESDISKGTSYVEPMLAKDFDNYIDKIDFKRGVFVQNKFNGVRCVARLEHGKVVLRSRKGEEWLSVPHINKDLIGFFKDHPKAILDGELYNYDLRENLNDLIHLVRRTVNITEDIIFESEKMVRFYVYDGYDMQSSLNNDAPYEARKLWLDKILTHYSKYYRKVETHLAHSMKEVDKIYEAYLADGEEGAIIRFVDSPYEHKRSKFLLKYKPEDDAEGIILELHEGTGNWSGAIKTATLLWDGKEFDATFKGKYELGVQRMKNKKDWIGKTVTFLYTGLTGLGVPNFARIDPNNCFKGDR